MHRTGAVLVCFSAGNLEYIAKQVRGRRFVIADNDRSGRGQAAAEATGLPWAMPPTEGDDLNDHHQSAGLFAVATLMRQAIEMSVQ